MADLIIPNPCLLGEKMENSKCKLTVDGYLLLFQTCFFVWRPNVSCTCFVVWVFPDLLTTLMRIRSWQLQIQTAGGFRSCWGSPSRGWAQLGDCARFCRGYHLLRCFFFFFLREESKGTPISLRVQIGLSFYIGSAANQEETTYFNTYSLAAQISLHLP